MADREMNRRWGNPATKAFRKQHIRTVEAGGSTINVNALLTGIVAGMLADAGSQGIMLPTTISAYQPLKAGKEPKPVNYGIAIKSAALQTTAPAYGFTPQGGMLVFTGNLEQARQTAAEAERKAVLVRVAPETDPDRPQGGWSTDRPGVRELKAGDRGADVYFYQLVTDAPDLSGTFDPWCEEMARFKQKKYGLKVTGTVTRELWAGMVPNERRGVKCAYGDTGIEVTVLQAALKAYDWGNLHITGRFDKDTTRAVNNLQETYGLRVYGGVGVPEWAALLGNWPPSLP